MFIRENVLITNKKTRSFTSMEINNARFKTLWINISISLTWDHTLKMISGERDRNIICIISFPSKWRFRLELKEISVYLYIFLYIFVLAYSYSRWMIHSDWRNNWSLVMQQKVLKAGLYTMKFFFQDLETFISKEKCRNISVSEMCVMEYYSVCSHNQVSFMRSW